MYDENQYNSAVFQQQAQAGNLPPQQQFGGGVYMQSQQEIANAYQQQAQQQVHVQQQTQQQQGVRLITEQQAQQLIESLRPTPISNPVKIDKSSYVVTEEQLQYLLSLSEGNPLQTKGSTLPDGSNKNTIDTLGEMTLGTVNRLGHTFTGLINSVISVLTLGYGQEPKK